MNRISELRKEEKLSQKDLGKIVDAAQNTVCNWENGNREPDYVTLKKLAYHFNCSIDYLLGTSPVGRTFNFGPASSNVVDELSASENSFLASYRLLNEEGQEKAVDYLDDLVQSGKYKKHHSALVDKSV